MLKGANFKMPKVGRVLEFTPVPKDIGATRRIKTDGFPMPFRIGINSSHPYLKFGSFEITSKEYKMKKMTITRRRASY